MDIRVKMLTGFMQMVNCSVFWAAAEGGKWIKASQGKLPDKLCQEDTTLADCLAACQYPLISAPAHIVAAVRERLPNAVSVSPGHIRTAIRKNAAFQSAMKAGPLEQRLKASLLVQAADLHEMAALS